GDPDPVAIAWHGAQRTGPLLVRDGWFESPAPQPEASKRAALRLITPAGGGDRTCLLMAAWNDHTYATRTRLARALAARGIGSVVLHQPFYGPRRPDPAHGQPIRTVSDFMVMGRAALDEGRSLLRTLGDEGHRVGVSGYSMGGNMAALIAATVPFPVATAPLAASHSPAPVYLDGVLRHGIAWEALGGEEAAAGRLRRIMLTASVLRLPPPPHAAAAVIVAARSDGYVPREASDDLHRHWPGSVLRRVPGGHATLLWFHTETLATAVADAFLRTFG
ncbi:MAG: abhydrolase domain-containing 18, partial [Actinobacteria bacterium]